MMGWEKLLAGQYRQNYYCSWLISIEYNRRCIICYQVHTTIVAGCLHKVAIPTHRLEWRAKWYTQTKSPNLWHHMQSRQWKRLTPRDRHTNNYIETQMFVCFFVFLRVAHHFLSYPGDNSLKVFYSFPVLGRAAVGVVNRVVPAVLVQAAQVFLAGRRGHDR